MTTMEIGGIAVIFPYDPYPIQIDYMSNVIKCCQNAENGLLESPTGTGKTLSLLCSSLAWLSNEKRKSAMVTMRVDSESAAPVPAVRPIGLGPKYKVIYTSRTHKQLAQAMDEMKRTVYQQNLTAICLASRDQYCVNDKVRGLSTLTEKNQSCKEKRSCRNGSNFCEYYRNPNAAQPGVEYGEFITSLQSMHINEGVPERGAVIDIEQLVTACISQKGCPYYTAQFAATTDNETVAADIIFCPYNYIFNGTDRLSLRDAIIIFDEGHNIEKTCEEAGSADISTFTLKQCYTGLYKLANDQDVDLDAMRLNYENLQPERLKKIASFAERLSDSITSTANDAEVCKPAVTWFPGLILGKLSVPGVVNPQTGMPRTEMLGCQSDIFKELTQFFAENEYRIYLDGKGDGTKQFLTALDALSEFLQFIFPPHCDRTQYVKFMKDNFRVAISKIVQEPKPVSFKLDLFCMNPGVAINKLLQSGVRSIIVTSGTLSPLNSFECELGIQFRYKLTNPHVVAKDQLMIFPVEKYGECVLDGSYRASYGNENYYRTLGMAISNYVKVIPKGVLIFFKSYANLRTSVDVWQRSNIMSQIQSQKKVFEEPRDLRTFNHILEDYKKHVDDGKGAILVAVYRGKISEGLDLADDYCRGVIVIGLPFPAWTDPHVELKREYLDVKKDVRLSKDRWYNNQMLRAVSQAIGRVVRHRNDYGVVILIDCAYKTHMKSLSTWMQDFIRTSEEFKSQTFAAFFRSNASRTKPAFPLFVKKALKRPESPAILTVSSDDEANGQRQPLAAKRTKLNLTIKTIPIRTDSSNALNNVLDESLIEIKSMLQKEKVNQLLVIMREMKQTRSVANFTAGIQKTFFGLPRAKIAKHIRGISLLLDQRDRRAFLRKFGISEGD